MIENRPIPFENVKPSNIMCHKCNYQWTTKSDRYRVSCPNCGAWVINENAKYKPTR